MEQIGWIKLHKQLLQWEWYTDSVVKELFLHLLLKAKFKDESWKGIQIKRGQVLTGRIKLSQELALTQQQIRTALKKLKSTNEITIKTTNKFSLVTLVNYDSYQGKKDPSTSKITDKALNEQPTTNQQLTTVLRSKEDNKERSKEDNLLEPNQEPETRTSFEDIPIEIYSQISEDYNKTFKDFKLEINPQDWHFLDIVKLRISEGTTIEDFKTVHSQAKKDWGNQKMARNLKYGTLYKDEHIKSMLENSNIVIPNSKSNPEDRKSLIDKFL